ncbi:PseG/SpsG family protein [Halosimplex halobium]|uniref:PseG/SpsG family protein n=1 Tax=Halosimplex halobium TaxID=3396618 RepID=UPI003F560DE4
MHVAVRADGGPEIGYGHLVRTSALVEALLNTDHVVTIATTTPQNAQEVYPEACSVVEVSSRGDPETFLDRLSESNPDAVVTDAYPIDTDYQRAVMERYPHLVIQDDARHTICSDVLVNGNLYAPSLDYEYIDDQPQWCLGPEYLLLRRAIAVLADDEPPWRDPPKQMLVTMGGSDIARLTPTVIRAVNGFDLHVDAIVGPGCSEEQEQDIRDAASTVSTDVRVDRDPDDFPKRMFEADLAVSTASTTTYELLALGTPIVSCPVVDNQQPIATALRERDAATVVEPDGGETEFQTAVNEYLNDPELRQSRRQIGRNLVDGHGTRRVLRELLSLAGENTDT